MSDEALGSASQNIGIVGAGIGGLALAVALKRKGFEACVFERRARHQIGGEGIFLTLAPNGMNALRGLGLAELVRARGVVTTGIELQNADGQRLGLIDYSAHAGQFGAPWVTIRRGELGEILLAAALAEGVPVRFGAPMAGLSESADGVTVSAGAESVRFGLLVGRMGCAQACGGLRCRACPGPCSTA